MKYVITYLLIGIILQILFCILSIICKSVIEDMMHDTGKFFNGKDLDDKELWKMAQSPKSIFFNIIAWPFNIALALYTLCMFLK